MQILADSEYYITEKIQEIVKHLSELHTKKLTGHSFVLIINI